MNNELLKNKLENLFDNDQDDRKKIREGKLDLETLKLRDSERVEEFVGLVASLDKWPTKSEIGEKAVAGAFVMAQHNNNTIFQKKCLLLMKENPESDQEKRYIAYLTDRILIHEGKAQRYGTQFRILPDGNQEIYPIEDESNLSIRRKEMGL